MCNEKVCKQCLCSVKVGKDRRVDVELQGRVTVFFEDEGKKFGGRNGGKQVKKVAHLGKRDIVDTTSHA